MTKWSAKFYMGWWFCASFPYIGNFYLSLPVWRKHWFFWQTQTSTWRRNFETLKEIKIPGLAVPKLWRSQHTFQRVKSLQTCWSGTTFLLACPLWRCPNLEKEEMKATCAPPFRTCNYRKGNPSSLCRASTHLPERFSQFQHQETWCRSGWTDLHGPKHPKILSPWRIGRGFRHPWGWWNESESDVPMFLP